MPGNNGGSIYFTTAADAAHGMVYVICKNVPSLIKLRIIRGPLPLPAAGSARAGRAGGDARVVQAPAEASWADAAQPPPQSEGARFTSKTASSATGTT